MKPDCLSILYCDFSLIPRSRTSHVTFSLIVRAPYTYIKSPGNEAENYWHLNT